MAATCSEPESKKVEAYMLGHAKVLAALDLSKNGLIEEDTPGRLIRIERTEAIELAEASPIQITEESRFRLYEDGFVQCARIFIKDYDYVWAVFSPNENFDITDIFIRITGPDIQPGSSTEKSGVMLEANKSFCIGCNTESNAGCAACITVDSVLVEELDYKALIDIHYGKVQEINIPKLSIG